MYKKYKFFLILLVVLLLIIYYKNAHYYIINTKLVTPINHVVLTQIESNLQTARYVKSNYICPDYNQPHHTQKFFSQVFEDYILSIVFKDKSTGTYIDVGAYHSDILSVTKYFYDHGWNGINIEPAKELYEDLNKKRPRDINLNVGVSYKSAIMKFYSIGELSTFDDKIAKQHHRHANNYNVPVTTLNNILGLHPIKSIDFIKIDVEGFEKEVLQGLNLKIYRPAVFILEAIHPVTKKAQHHKWEHILLKNNYKLMLFDGLNRYYLAKEHDYLESNFIKAGVCSCLKNQIIPKTSDIFINKNIINNISS